MKRSQSLKMIWNTSCSYILHVCAYFWYNKNLFWRGIFSKDDRLSAKVKNVERNAIPIEKKKKLEKSLQLTLESYAKMYVQVSDKNSAWRSASNDIKEMIKAAKDNTENGEKMWAHRRIGAS